MAVVSRVATWRLDNGAGGFRQVTATAVTQDTAAGSSVDVTVVHSEGGLAPGGTTTQTLRFYDDAHNLVQSVALSNALGSQTFSFFFTNDGTSGGSPRCGLVEIALYAQRTTAVAYEVETDGSPSTAPAGYSYTVLDRGYIRGTTTLVEDISNTSLGGAPSAPAEYDESLFVRTTSGHVSYVARALTVALSHGSVSGSTNSTTSATRDVTFSNVCDDRFPAASTSVGVTVTVPNASLLAIPDWTYTSTTDDTLNVDPRLTQALHFQVDDNAWGLAKHDSSKQMLSTQSGFLWAKFTAARGTLKSGITANLSLDPTNPGTTVGPTSFVSDANGVAGPLEWTASKPGGSWAWAVDITAPADIDANTHLLTPTDSVTMLNTDPRVSVMIRVGPSSGTQEDRHLQAGDSIKVAVCVFNRVSRAKIGPDASPTIALVRYDASTGWQYLSSGGTWTAWGTGSMDSFTTITDPIDADCFSYTFSSTSGWDSTDLVAVQCSFTVAGTPYGFYVSRELVGSFNQHSTADVVSLALNDLTDVETTGVASGDVLYYDGAGWRDEHMPTAAEVANAVWDELTTETRPSGSYGKLVRDSLPVPAVDPAAIVNATWDELTSETRTAGSYGQLVKDSLPVPPSGPDVRTT